MATAKKKPSSRKTKTARKTAAVKSTAKKTAKKPAAAKAAATKVSKFELLKRFHVFSAVVAASVAVLAVILLNNQAVDLTMTYSTKDPIASDNGTVLGTAHETIYSVELRHLLAGIFLAMAVLSLLLATTLRSRYEAGVKNATSFYRWLFAGVSFGLVAETITLLAGVQDIVVLKSVVVLAIVSALLGYKAERENKSGAPAWISYYLAVATGVLASLPAVSAIVGTHVYGIERYGWHIYALAAVVLGIGLKLAINNYNYIKYPAVRKDYVAVEEKYLSNEMLLKLAFAAIIFIAFID